MVYSFNSLPDDKTLALLKLKATADENFIVAQTALTFCDRVEKILVKR